MKKLKELSFKHYVAVTFCMIIFVCGFLTVTINFREVFGGLVRGYLKMPSDSTVAEKLQNSLSTFDKRMNEYFIFHDITIDSYGGIQKLLDKHLIDDADPKYNVVKLKNEYLTFKDNYSESFENTKDYLVHLKSVCSSIDAKMLFVRKLSKSTYDHELLPDHYPYHYSSDFKDLKPEIEAAGIRVLDLEDLISQNNIDKYSLFYKTDHHWTIRTGLWVSSLIAQDLNSAWQYNCDLTKLDINNYYVDFYKDHFLGTQGVRTGCIYTNKDDFEVIYPKYDTNIEYSARNQNLELSGNFLDTILFQKDHSENYGMYMPTRYDLTIIKNNEINNSKHAVFIIDSFGSAVAPFLSQTFKQTDCIDLRYFNEDLDEYLVQSKPDVLIYMVNWTDKVHYDEVK